jgi:hypothetical protein
MKFEGEFRPPAMGTTVAPINITGPGHCTITESGLEVTGFKSRSLAPLALVILGVYLAVTIWLGIEFGLEGWLFKSIVAAGACGLVGAFTVGIKRKKQGRPISLTIPWSSVKRAELAPNTPETVLIVVRKFKPKGGLFFAPKAEMQPFLEAVWKNLPTPKG